ncbi:STAS domain-containing protein [Streptomyces sp. NRRL S-920]|uniref:STAS domain-containing protein n=1 Tax=Streptomyces sp. NRRL S-920 TaxID=1463921 RepID=UPI0004C6BBB9|nr:STAS domain-containing protein [Streptomyces sp. NRRL S-920]
MPFPLPAARCIASVHTHGTGVLVRLCGEIDLATAPDVTAYLDTLSHAGSAELLIDLRQVEFMDGSAVRLLNRAWSRAGAGRLRLICTDPVALRLLRHPSLHVRFEILDQLPAPTVPPRTAA